MRRHFCKAIPDTRKVTYKPVIAVFTITLLMAAAMSYTVFGDVLTIQMLQWFIAFSICVFGDIKLQDLENSLCS